MVFCFLLFDDQNNNDINLVLDFIADGVFFLEYKSTEEKKIENYQKKAIDEGN